MTVEELLDDAECIGGLTRDADRPPYPVNRSTVHSFRFPPQDFKMRIGDAPLRAGTLEPAGEIVALDEDEGRVALKLGPKRTPFSEPLSLIPQGPIGDQVLRNAIYRYAEAVRAGEQDRYQALTGILRRAMPRVEGVEPGAPIVAPGADLLTSSVDTLWRAPAAAPNP